MIILKIEKYCHNCPYFEPEISKREYTETVRDPFTMLEFDTPGIVPMERSRCDTVICCKHRVRCNDICIHISETVGRESKK